MPNRTNTGTGEYPLVFAKELTKIVNREWESGNMLRQVTPVTADLLRWWFEETFTTERDRNFHIGQRQAILNAIYVHEVLKSGSVSETYSAVGQDTFETFTSSGVISEIQKPKYSTPKMCIKMATGTGKTWVLNALLIWQYLNAKYYDPAFAPVKYTKNFLIIAPGLIVYERLLDAFLGKQNTDGSRDFNTSDIKQNEDLFLPDRYRDDIYSFVRNSVADKTEIKDKVTADGIIAITNWHTLNEEIEEEQSDIELAGTDLDDSKAIVKYLLPVTPGTAAGNALETLDNRYLRGGILEYLAGMSDICVFNDEAHHIHESKTSGKVNEVKWQEALDKISAGKARNFIQIDFSATPYDVTGSGKNRTKNHFPHIIVDFDLSVAMRTGLVKSWVMDKRKEVASLSEQEGLDFKAVRDETNKVLGISEGQRVLLRAGLAKLKILEEAFAKLPKPKYPKMLVICEDTNVSPEVVKFLMQEGLSADEIMNIDSGKKAELGEAEWAKYKQTLFALDKSIKPKVVVSVLMLREGFDVNNICVIVPLRSSQAPILLEQVLGRGLRLMFREPEFQDSKAENRKNMYDLHKEPINYLDTLFVVEHPAFLQFYDKMSEGLMVVDPDPEKPRKPLGDMITVGLKPNYKDYDMFFPLIIKDKEETLNGTGISIDKLHPLERYNLEQLKNMLPKDNAERFYSEEIKVGTRFGEYKVTGDIFTAKSYNEFLQKILNAMTVNIVKATVNGHTRDLPTMQIDNVALVSAIDEYIRTKLFDRYFDPFEGNNWRVLLVLKGDIISHIIKEFSIAIHNMQMDVDVSEAVVEKQWFSSIDTMMGREDFALDIVKSIYEKTFYPSNKGGLERDFLEFADTDSAVEKIIKINEFKHSFARFRYIRSDGMLATYYPDFMIKIDDKIYVVETKGNDKMSNPDVQSKQRGALDWIGKINELKPEDRMNCEWNYVLLSDTNFYAWKSKGASTSDILEMCKLSNAKIENKLF